MLDYIMIYAPISPIEANHITANNYFEYFVKSKTGGKTIELEYEGIKEVNVWFDFNRIISEPLTEQYCTINALIDVAKMGGQEIDSLLKKIEENIPMEISRWKIKSAVFTYNFTGYLIKTYYKLLCGGYDLPRNKLKKSVTRGSDKFGNEICTTEYTGIFKDEVENEGETGETVTPKKKTESLHLAIELKQYKSEDRKSKKTVQEKRENIEKLSKIMEPIIYVPQRVYDNRLQIKIRARKKKIVRICREFGIASCDLKTFMSMEEDIEKALFEDYIMQITGKGDFYKYKDAEALIMKKDCSKREKEKMCDVLRAVASYKGISNYLNHVEDEDCKYKNMASVRKKPYARKVLNNIQDCGINPLTIPTRTEIPFEKLDNLVTVYKNSIDKEFDFS